MRVLSNNFNTVYSKNSISSKSSMQSLKYGLAVATIPLSALWATSATFAHVDSAKDNPILNSLVSNQNLLASLIFGTVATSGFLSMYPLRSINFALAALGALGGYFALNAEDDEDKKHNISQILEAIIIGFLGVAAVSKGNVSHKSNGFNFEFPQANNLNEVKNGWQKNLGAETSILKEQLLNFPSLSKDFLVGTANGLKNVFFPNQEFKNLGKLDRFREAATKYGKNWSSGAFQITGIMRLLACGLTLSSLLLKNDEVDNSKAKKQKDGLADAGGWLVSLSLIPAAIAALNKNTKWGALPNLLFNASALLAIPGLGFKLIPKDWINKLFGEDNSKSINDFVKIAGGLCTKVLIALQMLAYALSQCVKK